METPASHKALPLLLLLLGAVGASACSKSTPQKIDAISMGALPELGATIAAAALEPVARPAGAAGSLALRAGMSSYKLKARRGVRLCGRVLPAASTRINGFRGRVVQSISRVAAGVSSAPACADLMSACEQRLGPPTKRIAKGALSYVRYEGAKTRFTIRQVKSARRAICLVNIQHRALERALAKRLEALDDKAKRGKAR